MCDVAYWVLRERVEREALAWSQTYATYEASGRFEMRGERSSVSDAIAAFDEALDAEFEVVGSEDRELLELMGLA